MIKKAVKSVLRSVAPAYFDRLLVERANRHGLRVLQERGVPAVREEVLARFGPAVQTGPFAGMKYLDQSIGSSYVPKVIGSYERELAPVVERALSARFDRVIDVGCAEGFYAVGFAYRRPDLRVAAFDLDPQARLLCESLARLNGVEGRVEIRGACDHGQLNAVIEGANSAFVLCDCEGYELELLDPRAAPALARAEVLVELHDGMRPGITPQLLERFRPTHETHLIDATRRDPDEYPLLNFLAPDRRVVALDEFRGGPQQWGHFVPRASAAQ